MLYSVLLSFSFTFQQPGIGGEVVPHQDNTFLYTEPLSCTGLWLALEDATVTNGCLWAIPGSHKSIFVWPNYLVQKILLPSDYLIFFHLQCLAPEGLQRRMIRDENGTHFDRPSPLYDQKEFVPLEVKSGDFVVIHGDLVHQR